MKSLKLASVLAALLLIAGSPAIADHHGEKKTRVGTCEDAKKQQEYFCDQKMPLPIRWSHWARPAEMRS